jgi:predicted  nucleic acid-binding Zn-ribbon protein
VQPLEENIKRINSKLQLLLKKHSTLQKDNERLTKELLQAKKRNETAATKIDELQQQVSILKAAAADLPDADKKEFEKRINQYIKEIDKCIAFIA